WSGRTGRSRPPGGGFQAPARTGLLLDDQLLLLDVGLVERIELLAQALARGGAELCLELLDLCDERSDGFVVENARVAQVRECVRVTSNVVEELTLETQNVLNRDLVEVTVGAR